MVAADTTDVFHPVSQKRFTQKRELGGGGFGEVVLAYDSLFKKDVAIKILYPKYQDIYLREGMILDRVRDIILRSGNRHLITFREPTEYNGRPGLVMEYAEGGSLRDRLGRIGEQKALPLQDALQIAIGVCLGLEAVHKARITRDGRQVRIFHRDIKPENLLFRSNGEVMITDFGIGTLLGGEDLADTRAGSWPYMAPEVINHIADHHADIYSLGVVIYEMVTADLPFQSEGKPVGQFIAEVCRGKPKAPADISNVPHDLSDIILWAMHHETAQRCQSAKELRQTLEKVHASLEGEEADLPTYPPESPELDRLIAEAWKENKPQALEPALKNIIARFPDHPQGYCSLAEFYNKQLLVRQAIQVLEEGRRRCRTDSKLLMNLAAGYYATKQQQRALDTLREASRLSLLPDMKERINVLLNAWGRKA